MLLEMGSVIPAAVWLLYPMYAVQIVAEAQSDNPPQARSIQVSSEYSFSDSVGFQFSTETDVVLSFHAFQVRPINRI